MRWFICFILTCSMLYGSERLLYVIQTEEATVKHHENSKRYATLVMNKIGTAVSYFSDDKKAGTLSVEDFMLLWQKGTLKFYPVPAVTAILDGKGKEHRVELRNPSYDPMKQTAQFELFLIDGTELPADGPTTVYVEREAL